jgi:hypothetical protein
MQFLTFHHFAQNTRATIQILLGRVKKCITREVLEVVVTLIVPDHQCSCGTRRTCVFHQSAPIMLHFSYQSLTHMQCHRALIYRICAYSERQNTL